MFNNKRQLLSMLKSCLPRWCRRTKMMMATLRATMSSHLTALRYRNQTFLKCEHHKTRIPAGHAQKKVPEPCEHPAAM